MLNQSTSEHENETHDSHASWLKLWRRQSANCEQTDEISPEGKAAWAQREALARKLASVPASSIEALAAQLAFINEDMGYYISEMVGSPFNRALRLAAQGAAHIATVAKDRKNGTTGRAVRT